MRGFGSPPHHHHHDEKNGRTGQHPIFKDFAGGSKKAFRKFIDDRGIFGDREDADNQSDPEEQRGEGLDARGTRAKYIPKGEHKNYIKRFFNTIGIAKLIPLLVCSVLVIGCRSAMPWAAKLFLDYVLPHRNFELLWKVLAAFLAIGISAMILMGIEDVFARRMMGNFITGMRRKLMKHLHSLPIYRLQELKVGGLVSRLQSDTEAMTGLLHSGILTPFNAILMIVVCLSSLFIVNWKVTIICLVFCMCIVLAAYFFFRRIRPLQRMLREDLSAISAHVAEMFGGIMVVRAFSRSNTEALAYGRETNLLWRKRFHTHILNMVLHRCVFTVYILLNSSIWGVGGYYYIKGEITVGDIMIFHFFIHWLFQPIFMIMSSFADVQRSLACTERVFDLLDEPESMPDKPGALPVTGIDKGIVYENVGFSYEKDKDVLSGISFDIPVGKVTALVGPSGGGKSTIVNLLLRFYDVIEGRITLDGTDIRELRQAEYRKLFGLVLQDVFLFDGKVKENIAYGRLEATDEDIIGAAKAANCHEFISELEKGYDSFIGERGVKLSGGQRQRLALARALLADPQVLVLDEATSNLDSESEMLIQDALKNIMKKRTTLVIAHRLSTIMDADNIIVLDDGCKVEEGTHEELLARKGRYYDLYTTQTQKEQNSQDYLNWDDLPGPSAGANEVSFDDD